MQLATWWRRFRVPDTRYVRLPSFEENMTDFHLRVFAADIHEAFGDRSSEMSDNLLQTLRKLWDNGVKFGRNGVPPIPEVNDPRSIRGALERLAQANVSGSQKT